MGKLPVQLLVLIALGTISRCQDVGGPPPGLGAVIPSALPSSDCGRPMPENLGFGGTEFTIPGSGVVYRRVTVRDVHLEFATESSVSLPSDSFLECAIAAAGADLDAFTFEGSCTGYLLNLNFLPCQPGDVAVYVRPENVNAGPALVPMDEAPYKLIDDGVVDPYRVYMLSDYLVPNNNPCYKKTDKFEEIFRSDPMNNFVSRENGDIIYSNYLLLDVNSCLNNGAYGLKVVFSPALYDATFPVVYFYEECGNTIQIPNSRNAVKMLMFSHRGFGCQPYPSGLPDKCSVVFEREYSPYLGTEFGFFFTNDNYDAAGLIARVVLRNSGGWFGTRLYWPRKTRIFDDDEYWFNVSMQRQPSKPAVGFFMSFS